jgi:hypothetical protein
MINSNTGCEPRLANWDSHRLGPPCLKGFALKSTVQMQQASAERKAFTMPKIMPQRAPQAYVETGTR